MIVYEGTCLVENRRPPIKRSIRTNEDEAQWLEDTVIMRVEEGLATLGLNVKCQTKGLRDLFLLSLNKASERGRKERANAR